MENTELQLINVHIHTFSQVKIFYMYFIIFMLMKYFYHEYIGNGFICMSEKIYLANNLLSLALFSFELVIMA